MSISTIAGWQFRIVGTDRTYSAENLNELDTLLEKLLNNDPNSEYKIEALRVNTTPQESSRFAA
jgi:hypothetical protein